MRERTLEGASGSFLAASVQRRMAAVSWLRQADSASNSRAVWRNTPEGAARGSRRWVISSSFAVSTSKNAARTAASSLMSGCAVVSPAILS